MLRKGGGCHARHPNAGNSALDPEPIHRGGRAGHVRRLGQPHRDVAETACLLRGWVRDYQNPAWHNWAVRLRAGGALIGAIAAVTAEEGDALEPGYALSRAHWGHGYMTEALRAVVDYLFTAEGQTVLRCCHAVENPASGRVMQKVGFHCIGEGVYHKYDGTAVPCKNYLLLKEEFYNKKGVL